MEINASSIFEEFLCSVSLVSTSPQVPHKQRILQLTCFIMPPLHVSKSTSPFDHMAAGTDLLTHTAVLLMTVLNTCCTGESCNIICGYKAITPPTRSRFSQRNPRYGPMQCLATFRRKLVLPPLHPSELSSQEYRGKLLAICAWDEQTTSPHFVRQP